MTVERRKRDRGPSPILSGVGNFFITILVAIHRRLEEERITKEAKLI
jgi:hypothetical protein